MTELQIFKELTELDDELLLPTEREAQPRRAGASRGTFLVSRVESNAFGRETRDRRREGLRTSRLRTSRARH